MWIDEMMSWNRIASRWIQFVRQSPESQWAREKILYPAVLELLGPIERTRVLDAGCGEGYMPRRLALAGANVTGIDVSTVLLAAARSAEQEQPHGITYLHRSITNLHGVPDQTFDAAASVLVLNLVEELAAAFKELHRVLRPGGRLVVAILHPCFDHVGAGWIRRGPDVRWSANRYIDHVRGISSNGVTSYHRPLSAYITAALEAGFLLSGFREPVTPDDLSRGLHPGQRPMDQIPPVAVMRFHRS